MSNQRPGKVKAATMRDDSTEARALKFFKLARTTLEERGEEDAAFYMEQMEDWLQRGNEFPRDNTSVARAFGL